MLRPVLFALSIFMLVLGSSQHAPKTEAAPLIVEIGLFGREQVPAVNSVGYGFVRFFFNDDRTAADYTVDVKNISTADTTGADIHRGRRGEVGPVVFHLTDGGFIVTGGQMRFSRRDIDEMLAGDWYISLTTLQNPDGELRGQIVLPANFMPGSPTPVPTAPPPAPVAPPPPTAVPAAPPPFSAPAEPPASGQGIRPPSTGGAGLR